MILENYSKLNKSFKKQLSYKIGNNGFFSNYVNMIYAMLYCLDNKIQFNLCDTDNYSDEQDDAPYVFFKPFTKQVADDGKHYQTTNLRYAFKQLLRGNLNAVKSLFPYFNFWKKQLYTQDVWGKSTDLAAIRKQYVIPELQIDGDMWTACSRLVELTWRYTGRTKAEVENYMNTLNLPPSYIGFHIRRGDKATEVSLKNMDIYIKKAENLSSIRDAYVSTDDYTVIEELKKNYPQWHINTLCTSIERGYDHRAFTQTASEEKRNSMIILFANIELLAKSKFFIGNFYSNIGLYMGMRMDKSKVYSVDNFSIGGLKL